MKERLTALYLKSPLNRIKQSFLPKKENICYTFLMIKKEALKEIIIDFHNVALPKSNKRDLNIPINTGKVISLSGVRRSGKTYMLFETIKNLLASDKPNTQILYINFEDERIDINQDELDLILQAYRELYPDNDLSDCYFFFDEIQNVDGWDRFIRRLYDTITKHIFITGSNSRLLSKEIATSLRGRTINFEVFPLSFKENLRFQGVESDIYHSGNRARVVNLFEKFLRNGGFPEVLTIEDGLLRHKVLQDYFDVMLYRDMIERFNISNTSVLKYFLKRLFEGITSPLSVNKIYNELKSQGYRVGKNILYEYLAWAEDIYLFLTAKKYSDSVLKSELAEKKIYTIDSGLLNAVTFKYLKDYGKVLENTVFMEIYKTGKKVFFYKNRRECDFIVIDETGYTTVIQVAYSISDTDTLRREIEGLIEACRRLNLNEGYLLTLSEEQTIIEQGVRVNVMPVYKYLLEV